MSSFTYGVHTCSVSRDAAADTKRSMELMLFARMYCTSSLMYFRVDGNCSDWISSQFGVPAVVNSNLVR